MIAEAARLKFRGAPSALAAALSVALLTSLGAMGCGEPERSAAAYCEKYKSGFAQIKSEHPDVDQYSRSDENPLVMLLSVASAYGDVVALMGDMSEVAPDEIQTDAERVHETLKKQIDSAGDVVKNPLGALAGQLVAGITSSGAFNRMDAYTVEHCGEHMFGASPQ